MDVMSEVVQRKIILAGPQNECEQLAGWLEHALRGWANLQFDPDDNPDEFESSEELYEAYRTWKSDPMENTVSKLIDMLRGHFSENSST